MQKSNCIVRLSRRWRWNYRQVN